MRRTVAKSKSMKKRKKKARVWHSYPAPWRSRVPEIVKDICDMAQRQLEVSIGWGSGRAYDKGFSFQFGSPLFDDENFRNMMMLLFKWMMPDLQTVEFKRSEAAFGWVIIGRVKGVTPKLKRVRTCHEKRRHGRK